MSYNGSSAKLITKRIHTFSFNVDVEFRRDDAHLAKFDKTVHKPQSTSYGGIGANIQLIFTHISWIWILLSVHHNCLGSEGLQGTHIDKSGQCCGASGKTPYTVKVYINE